MKHLNGTYYYKQSKMIQAGALDVPDPEMKLQRKQQDNCCLSLH